MGKIKIIIVDDAKVTRLGLNFLFCRSNDFEVIGEAEDGLQFLSLLETKMPDIVLMDVSMPVMDGIEATKEATIKYPSVKIIALTNIYSEDTFNKMISAGAKAFLTKEIEFSELRRAILTIFKNGIYIEPKIVNYIKNSKSPSEPIVRLDLTQLESQVLKLLSDGNTIHKTAYLLDIKVDIIEQQYLNLLQKTKTTNRVALLMFAIKNSIV